MGSYQTLDAVRPRMQTGPVAMPVVDRALVTRVVAEPVAEPVQAKRRYVFITGVVAKEMRARRAQGETLNMLARRFNCTTFTVRKHTAGIKPPEGSWTDGGKESIFCEDEAKQLRAQGLTYLAIGERLGCCESLAHRLVNGRCNRTRGREPAVSKAVEFVARSTGVRAKLLRAPIRGKSKKLTHEVSKARAILFWLAHQREDEMTFVRIANALGFADTTIMDGVRKTERAIKKHGLVVGAHPGKIVRSLYRLSWQGVPCAK